jgi:hypothetical protein
MKELLERLYEARPRFLYLRLELRGFRFYWGFPLCALEEVLRLALRLGALFVQLKLVREPKLLAQTLGRLAFIDGLLRLPGGEPLLELEGEGFRLKLGQI